MTITIALSVLLLGGCADLVSSPDHAAANPAAIRRSYHDTLALDGRLSVQYQKNDSDEAINGSFSWRQNGAHTTITLSSPLGQILATIEAGPDGATLRQSGQAPRSAPDVDALAAQALGWPLPVSGLRNWLQGFATDAGNQPYVAAAADKTASVTTRDGWHIQYLSWQDDSRTPAQSRPKRIDLERQTAQAGKVAIRIVIDNWQAQ